MRQKWIGLLDVLEKELVVLNEDEEEKLRLPVPKLDIPCLR